jgi:hypothetical protein
MADQWVWGIWMVVSEEARVDEGCKLEACWSETGGLFKAMVHISQLQGRDMSG